MRILLITDEVWNDNIHGNNILTNWFQDFDAEFANIYCSPGQPLNNCCKKYFQITDSMMLKSMLSGKSAGKAFTMDNFIVGKRDFEGEKENRRLYTRLKSITTESLRAIREIIWYYGKYDIVELERFIKEFDPDIIFSPRLATIKLLRLENIVFNITKAPMVAFTGDDEYSMKRFRISPVFWIKKFIMRSKFRKMMPNYALYYTLSDEQKADYEKEFGQKFKILRKCGDFTEEIKNKEINKPIRLIYAGKLYSNRWKTLAQIVKALKKINQYETEMTLEIYTKDNLTKKQMKLLDDGENSFVKGSVTAEELKGIYGDSDIALHVESFDLKNRLLTKYSFSTKIIDCLDSGCAVIAICWDKHSGYIYLKNENAAITVSNIDDIFPVLKTIVDNPKMIIEYSERATNCGKRNHKRDVVQEMLYSDFEKVICKYKINNEKGKQNHESITN